MSGFGIYMGRNSVADSGAIAGAQAEARAAATDVVLLQ